MPKYTKNSKTMKEGMKDMKAKPSYGKAKPKSKKK